MPLSSLAPIITERFQEVNSLLTLIASLENDDPRQTDPLNVRVMRGLVYVHLYAALEYSLTQAFSRLAQHVSSLNIQQRHLELCLQSASLDSHFQAIQDKKEFNKKMRQRITTMNITRSPQIVLIRDDILSSGMQSTNTDMIALAFEIYGISAPPLYDLSAKGYINEVVERRHAVAHGREAASAVGVRRVSELRLRYDAVYGQAMYVLTILNEFCADKKFISSRFRRRY